MNQHVFSQSSTVVRSTVVRATI